MKLNKLFAFLLVAVLVLQVIAALQINFKVEATPSVVDSNISGSWDYAAMRLPKQHKLFYAEGLYWCFYYNGTYLRYKTSADGNSWSTPTDIGLVHVAAAYSDVKFDGTYIHYVRRVPSIYDLKYRKGTPNGDGTITWLDTEQLVQNSYAVGDPSLAVDSNGYPFISYGYYPAAYVNPAIIRSDFNNGTWKTTSGYPLFIAKNYYLPQVVSLQNSQVLWLYVKGYQYQSADFIYGKLYNGSGWENEVQIGNSKVATEDFQEWDCISDSYGYAHLLFINTTTKNLLYMRRDNVTGIWGSEEEVYSNMGTATQCALSWHDQNTIYAFWHSAPLADHIYYKSRLSGIWDSLPTDWQTDSDGMPNKRNLQTSAKTYNNEILVGWLSSTSSPYSAKFDKLTASLETTPPAYSDVAYSTTTAGQSCTFSCKWQDNVGLSGYIFSWNSTGDVWQNDTWTALSGNPAWANVTKTLPPEAGVIQAFMWYCNDTNNNWNNTGIQTLTTTTSGTNMVSLFFPYNVTSQYANSLNFLYYAKFYQTIQNSSLWLNLTGTWQRAAWNATPVINDSQFNPITFNFSTYGSATYVWSVEVFNSTGSQFAIYNRTLYVKLEPRYTLVSYNSTAQNEPCLFFSSWVDGDGLSGFIFGWNGTGSMVNETWTPTVSGWANTTKTLPSDGGTRIEFQFWVNDTDGWWNTTGLNFLITVSNAPYYSGVGYNTTLVGTVTLFSCYWQDDVALSGFIFSWSNGTWYNETWTSLTGTGAWANKTETMPNVLSVTISFKWYCNDSDNYWTTTSTTEFITTGYIWTFSLVDWDYASVKSLVTYGLYSEGTPLYYTEGTATLLNGTYQMVVTYHSNLIYNGSVDTVTYGSGSNIVFYLYMKQIATGRYLTFNQTISTLSILISNDTLLQFTVTATGSDFLIMVDVPRNCTYIQKDGVNQTGWIFYISESYIYLTTASLSSWLFAFETPPPPPEGVIYATNPTIFHLTATIITVYAQVGYELTSPQTSSTQSVILFSTLKAYWGWRIWLVYYSNSTTELSDGAPTGIVSRESNGEGFQTGIWNIPETKLIMGFTAIKLVLYMKYEGGDWVAEAVFLTDPLMNTKINQTSWFFTLYTKKSGSSNLAYWGSSTYDSILDNVELQPPTNWDWMWYNLMVKNLIGAFTAPYVTLIGPLFYGFALIILFVPIYLRSKKFMPIIITLILLGGIGGAILKPLVPGLGFEFGWVLVAVGLAGFIFKTVKALASQ